MFEAFCVEIRYDRLERRVEISATVSEAVAEAFENARDLPKEVLSCHSEGHSDGPLVPPSDARVVEPVRLAA